MTAEQLQFWVDQKSDDLLPKQMRVDLTSLGIRLQNGLLLKVLLEEIAHNFAILVMVATIFSATGTTHRGPNGSSKTREREIQNEFTFRWSLRTRTSGP